MARCVKRFRLGLSAVLVCLLGLTLPAVDVNADTTQPEEFWGSITINGAAAPAGTVIVASINGVERGTFTTTEAGQYGGTGTFEPRLVVSGEASDTGKTITFWVNGCQADQTAVYEPGESREFDLLAWVYPLPASDAQINKALNYLRLTQSQKSNGSIGGFEIDAWVVMAIAAAGEDPDTWTAGGSSIVDYLKNNAANLDDNKATDWERSLLAIVASVKNPRNFGGIDYVDKVKGFYDGNQMGGSTLLNDDFWGLLALAAIGESGSIPNSQTFIKNHQNTDGGWGFDITSESDADNTAAAISALVAAGEPAGSQTIINALNYLKSQQQNNGGFLSESVTNSAVDSWVINAIADAGQSPVGNEWRKTGNTPVEHLLSLQDTGGFFNYRAGVASQSVWMTAYALIALTGNSWPKDTTPPTISSLTPSSGTSTSTTSLSISASFADATSAIDTSSARMVLDGSNVTGSATVTASGISYAASLASGSHAVTVSVSDKRGNEASRSWSFQVVTDSGDDGGGGGGGGAGIISVSGAITQSGRFTKEVTGESEDGRVEITIPKNTVGKNRLGGLLSSIIIEEMTSPPAAPAHSDIIGLVYDLEPDGATFDPPIYVTFKYRSSQIPEGVAEENLVVAIWDDDSDEWEEIPGTVDTASNTITASVSHFTAFTILARTQPADFTVSNLSLTPAEVNAGERIEVSVRITNNGDLEGTYEVSLSLDNRPVQAREITLAGGGSETVSFSITAGTAGRHTVSIDDLSGSFTVREEAVSPETPGAALPAPVSALPLPSPQPETPEPEAPQATPPAPALPPSPSAEPVNWPLIAGIAGGVVVLGLIVFLVRKPRY